MQTIIRGNGTHVRVDLPRPSKIAVLVDGKIKIVSLDKITHLNFAA